MELARTLALTTIAFSRDAVVQELADRRRAIAETIWPQSPLSGYGLHASLGAYLVARVAITWAPSGPTGLRHEPLDREGLLFQLEEQGVEKSFALSVLGDFVRVERGFIAEPAGLDASRIAGLAEGSLTRLERLRALSQVAYSSRCLGRLASAVNVLSSVRTVLPVLPPEPLGPELAAAMVAIAVGRPERVFQLIGQRPEAEGLRTLVEFADAMIRLERGEAAVFDRDQAILVPEEEAGTAGAADDAGETSEDQDGDDVLEIVEERIERAPPPAPDDDESSIGVRIKPARWWTRQEAPTDVGDADLLEWTRLYEAAAGLVAKKNGLLGLRLEQSRKTVTAQRCPPDERFVKKAIAAGVPHEALFAPVRGALRAIARAAEGRGPSEEAVKHAGDLAWVLSRARALAMIVNGDLEGAVEATKALPAHVSPEGQWARDRLIRFGGRKTVRAEVREVRPVAGSLAADLLHQLGRTLAGTVHARPRTERMS
jgi:hypothetical protein